MTATDLNNAVVHGATLSLGVPTSAAANATARILVADRDPGTLGSLQQWVESIGCDVVTASDAESVRSAMSSDIGVVILSSDLRNDYGPDWNAFFRRQYPDAQLIITLDTSESANGVSAMEQGAIAYLPRPYSPEELLAYVRQGLDNIRRIQEGRGYRRLVEQAGGEFPWATESPAGAELSQSVDRVAAVDTPVQLIGEPGAGKGLVARMIHERSSKSAAPFIAFHCGSVPRGLVGTDLFGSDTQEGGVARAGRFQLAAGGTLFLDEIDELPLGIQAKLSEYLTYGHLPGMTAEETPKVRLIVASSSDLGKRCEQGYFLADLLERINLQTVRVPPLRERVADLPELIRIVLVRIGRETETTLRIDDAAVSALQQYSWPGNLHQLERVLERAAADCRRGLISAADLKLPAENDLPAKPNGRSLACRTLADVEKQAILETLIACKGNKARTARVLGISEKSIYNKMRRHGMSNPVS